ncbi:hypothetical protein BDW60DRAFT_220799 [Aspergillus nidulans var. acristatus]
MLPGSGGGREPESLRKRTRTGCLPCRKRRRKCDGARPICRNCQLKGSTCQWGLRASFHPSRSHGLSSYDSAALATIERQRNETDKVICNYPTIDDADASFWYSDESDYGEGTGDYLQGKPVVDGTVTTPHSSPAASPDVSDHSSCQPYSNLDVLPQPLPTNFSIGDLLFRQKVAPVERPRRSDFVRWALSPVSVPKYAAPFISPAALDPSATPLPSSPHQPILAEALRSPEPPLPVSDAEKARLVCAYMQETGTWCETTDSEMHFTVKSIHSMMRSPAFTAAVMALASRQLDHVRHQPRQVTLELYQYTIQLLLRQDPGKQDASVLAACTLLCVYEMMASGVHEWRRHLKGCAGHLQAQKWNGSSKGIVKSCFWAFARIEDMSIASVAAKGDVDDYCNLANLIFAEIVNLLAEHGPQEGGHVTTHTASISLLWEKMQDWRSLRPSEVKPLLRNSTTQRSVFPKLLYSRSSSICGNTFYHAGSILLLQTGAVWHARELGGISISNPSHTEYLSANWVNQLQPLYIAGTVFASSNNAPGWAGNWLEDVRASSESEVALGAGYPAAKRTSRYTWPSEAHVGHYYVQLLGQLHSPISRRHSWPLPCSRGSS